MIKVISDALPLRQGQLVFTYAQYRAGQAELSYALRAPGLEVEFTERVLFPGAQELGHFDAKRQQALQSALNLLHGVIGVS